MTDSPFSVRRLGLVAVGLLVVIAGALVAVSGGWSVPGSVESQETPDEEAHSTEPIGSIRDAEATLAVSNATVEPQTVRPNESITVTATLENPTAETVAAEINLAVDGAVEATLLETVEAGESRTVSFDLTITETGRYTLSVAGTDAGSVDVSQDTRDEIPGFGIVAAVSALVALVGVRRFTTASRNS